MDLSSAAFWAALGSIIWVNVILSGDNAVVIAMAARSLPPEQQKKAVFWGSAAAIVLRVILTLIAAEMMRWPYLKIIGGLLLLYIGIGLLSGDDDDGDGEHKHNGGLVHAIRTILIADLVMSLDNVLAVAAAAKGNVPLLVIGLALSIPLIIFGSTLLMKVMERLPILVTLGAALLGFLAGEMLMTDPALIQRFGEQSQTRVYLAGALGAALVVGIGLLMKRRAAAGQAG